MDFAERMRRLTGVCALTAIPMSWVYSSHFCMGGYRAHPPYTWYQDLCEFSWPVLFITAAITAACSDIRWRALFTSLILVTLCLVLVRAEPFAILCSLVLGFWSFSAAFDELLEVYL